MQKLLASLLFPQENACHLCERFLTEQGVLCPDCQRKLDSLRLTQPVLLRPMPPLCACVSACRYDGMARQLVHGLKYQADGALAQPLAEQMLAVLVAQPAIRQRVELMVPVPLHPLRLERRGYNQAERLARAVADALCLPLNTSALQRVRETATQVGRSRAQRLQAMRGVFAVTDPSVVRDKRILLVDDVLTTGATAMACAHALLEAGAAEVALLTACRA